MLGLLSLPYEVLSSIVGSIDFDDVFNLGLTCKSFKFLITEESLCRVIVLVRVFHNGLDYRFIADKLSRAKYRIQLRPRRRSQLMVASRPPYGERRRGAMLSPPSLRSLQLSSDFVMPTCTAKVCFAIRWMIKLGF